MDLPKCRTCGERHRLGGCPSNATKSSRGSTEGRAEAETKGQIRHSDSLAPNGGNRGTATTVGIKAGPRGTKPAKKAKPKKEKKNAASTDRKKNKVGKPNLKRRSKGHHRSELPGNSETQPIATVDAGQDLPRSAGDVAELAASPIRPGHPRKGEEHKTLTATKPWVALKMSRAGWYRNGKPMPGTKP